MHFYKIFWANGEINRKIYFYFIEIFVTLYVLPLFKNNIQGVLVNSKISKNRFFIAFSESTRFKNI